MNYPRIPAFHAPADFRAHLRDIGAGFDLDDAILPAPDSPLARPYRLRLSLIHI